MNKPRHLARINFRFRLFRSVLLSVIRALQKLLQNYARFKNLGIRSLNYYNDSYVITKSKANILFPKLLKMMKYKFIYSYGYFYFLYSFR